MFWIYGIFFVTISISGCTNVVQKEPSPMRRPAVLEEDISDRRQIEPRVNETLPDVPYVEGPPAQFGEGISPGGEPGDRPPRRIIWRDRRGFEKKSEPSGDGSLNRSR